jgi:redox-sensitive bicupin YhaK (pirin superfamily)
MSLSDFGRLLKPFVFLDLFDTQGNPFSGFGLHPHSGIATLTYVAEGSISYEDTSEATGLLLAGGVEWMRAGGGVWHGGGTGEQGRTRGFQLWSGKAQGHGWSTLGDGSVIRTCSANHAQSPCANIT